MGIHILPVEPGGLLLPAQRLHRIHHLALEALHQFQRHIEKVSGAAGGVQHAGGAKLGVKTHGEAARLFDEAIAARIARPQRRKLALVTGDGALDGLPFLAQGLDDSGDHQPLHIGARRVMGAQLAPLVGVERLFEQGSENRGVHLAPVIAGGLAQFADLLRAQGQHLALLEKGAVELRHPLANGVGVAADIHGLPQLAHIMGQGMRGLLAAFQHLLEALFRQKAHILRKHGEEAAHEKHGDIFGVAALDFERLGNRRQPLGDLAGDAGRAAGGIKGQRVCPDGAEQEPHGLAAQILQIDAEAAAIGKLIEGFAIAAEVCVKLEAMADIAHDEERRRLVVLRQQARIVLALHAGVVHQHIPGRVDGPAAALGGIAGQGGRRAVECVF